MDNFIEEFEMGAEEVLENLLNGFKNVRAGRANPFSLDKVMVEYYGSLTPLKSIANITVPEATELLIKPFDKSSLKDIEKGINVANLGFNPINDGESIRINIPKLTEDRRRELVKQVKEYSEEAKIALRNVRRDILKTIEEAKLPKDEAERWEDRVQEEVNSYNKKIEDLYKEKEKELMTV